MILVGGNWLVTGIKGQACIKIWHGGGMPSG